MSRSSDTINGWLPDEIKHVAMTLAGKKFEPFNQPARPIDPDEVVYGVFASYADPKVGYERTEGDLWVRTGSLSITRFYELDEAAAQPLLDAGERQVLEVLSRRARLTSVA